MIYADGSINEGFWSNGFREGKNYYKMFNGNTFFGIFKNDVPNGFGTENIQNESIYCGYMKEGLKHGQGTMKY